MTSSNVILSIKLWSWKWWVYYCVLLKFWCSFCTFAFSTPYFSCNCCMHDPTSNADLFIVLKIKFLSYLILSYRISGFEVIQGEILRAPRSQEAKKGKVWIGLKLRSTVLRWPKSVTAISIYSRQFQLKLPWHFWAHRIKVVIKRWKVLPEERQVWRRKLRLSKFLFILRTDSLVVPKPQNSKKSYDDQKRAHWKTSPVKSGVPIRLCEQKRGFKDYRRFRSLMNFIAVNYSHTFKRQCRNNRSRLPLF